MEAYYYLWRSKKPPQETAKKRWGTRAELARICGGISAGGMARVRPSEREKTGRAISTLPALLVSNLDT